MSPRMWPFGQRTTSATSTVTLEVAPRTAKLMAVTLAPFRIERVQASTLPEETDDPVAALRTLLEASSLGARQVGVLFGRESFSLRTLELPSVDPKEIASMLELQLGKLTPYPRSEILYAWTLIGSFRDGYTSVLLAVARKSLIQGVLQFLKTKGVTPLWVGVSTEGLEAWWAVTRASVSTVSEGQLVALIDVDATSTDCAIFAAKGQLMFTHSIAIGAEQLSASEEAKLRWVGELVRLPRILLHEEIKGQIGQGIVTGVLGGAESVVDQLTHQWGVEVRAIGALKPFAMAPTAVGKGAASGRVSYAALAGVVAAGHPPRIDLIPQEARVSQVLHARSKHLARLATSLGAILMLAVLLYGERIILLRHYLAQIQQQLTVIEPTAHEVMRRQEAMGAVRQWLNPAESALELFRSVAAAVNPDVAITQVTMEVGKPATIRGRAETMAAAFAFAERLKTQGRFSSVSARPVLRPKGTSQSGAEFEMVCEWTHAS